MEFREEGKKKFEVIYRYTARKICQNGTRESEFIMENKECFSIEVLCPFILMNEWITPDPNLKCNNTRFYFNGQLKTNLGLDKKAILGVKISTGSFPKVDIHGIKLKVKDGNETNYIDDCTKEVNEWKEWPITLNESESLAVAFSILPLKLFNEQQIAEVEIQWNRTGLPATERAICSIPLLPTSTIDSCINISIASLSPKAIKYKEFFVDYIIRNTTSNIIEIKVSVGEALSFFLGGDLEARLILPPYEFDNFKLVLVPLKCGKFELPSISVSMIAMGGVSEPIIDNNFKYSIYVFPN